MAQVALETLVRGGIHGDCKPLPAQSAFQCGCASGYKPLPPFLYLTI
jgi:hypothetical protein